MNFKNFKRALLISAVIGAGDVMGATMADIVAGDVAVTTAGAFTAAGDSTHQLTGGGTAFYNTVTDVVFSNAAPFGTTTVNVMNTGDITLTTVAAGGTLAIVTTPLNFYKDGAVLILRSAANLGPGSALNLYSNCGLNVVHAGFTGNDTIVSNIYIAEGSTLTITSTGTNNLTLSGAITGGGTLLWSGSSGTLSLSGVTNTFYGKLLVAAGSSGSISAPSQFTSSTQTVSQKLYLPVPGSKTFGALTSVGGQTTAVLDTTQTVTFNGALGAASPSNIVLDIQNSGAVSLTNSARLYPPTSGAALLLNGGNTVTMDTAAFPVASGVYPSIDVLSNSTLILTAGQTYNMPIILASGKTLTVNVASGSVTLAGIISGAGNLLLTGAGDLVLTGANTFTGTATNSGTGSLFLTPVALVDGQTYTTARALTTGVYQAFNVAAGLATISSVLSGAGGFIKTGAGVLALSGANTFTGTFTIGDGTNAAGTLQCLNAAALGAGTANLVVSANAAATLMIGSTATALTNFATSRLIPLSSNLIINAPHASTIAAFNGIISGANTVTKNGNGRINMNAVNTYSSGTTVNAGTLSLGVAAGAGTGSVTCANGVTIIPPTGTITVENAFVLSGNTIFNMAAITDITTLSGVISGAGALQKNGAGNVILSGTNTYTGDTIFNGGTITAANAASLGAGSSLSVTSVSTLTINANVVLPGTLTDVSVNAAFTINLPSGYSLTIPADISGAAAGIITKAGAGNITATPPTSNSQLANILHTAGTMTMGNSSTVFPGNIVCSVGAKIVTNNGSRMITNTGTAPIVYNIS